MLVTNSFLRRNKELGLQLATLTVIAFDCHLWPSEGVELAAGSVVPPAPAGGATYARRAAKVVPQKCARPAKNQQYDGTKMVRLRLAKREWVDNILKVAYSCARRSNQRRLFSQVDLGVFERETIRALRSLELLIVSVEVPVGSAAAAPATTHTVVSSMNLEVNIEADGLRIAT